MNRVLWTIAVGLLCAWTEGAPVDSRATPSNSTTLTSNIGLVRPGLTKHLNLNCSFPGTQTAGVASLISLVISQLSGSENQKDLASVSSFDPDQLTKMGSLKADVDWLINERQGSFLSLAWMYPNSSETGYYTCEANALDHTGHPVKLRAGLTLQVKAPDLTSLAERFREVQQSLDNFRDKLDDPTSNLFVSSRSVNGSMYLMSKYNFEDVDKAQGYCNWAGGYLVEFNSQGELDFVLNFTKDALTDSGVTYFLIGLSDEKTEGDWVYRSSGEKPTYTNWASGEPNSGASNDCAYARKTDFLFYDHPCTTTSAVRFLCEVESS